MLVGYVLEVILLRFSPVLDLIFYPKGNVVVNLVLGVQLSSSPHLVPIPIEFQDDYLYL